MKSTKTNSPKPTKIDWDKRQLVTNYKEMVIVLTTGKHTEDYFEGVVVHTTFGTEYIGVFKDHWRKCDYDKYDGGVHLESDTDDDVIF